MIAWTQIEPDFEWDGSLRDIYVRPVTLKDWQATYALVKSWPSAELTFDGEPARFPDRVADVFAAVSQKHPLLSVKLGTVTAVFHFFTEEEIECDIDPREVKTQMELDEVLSFLRQIGDCTAKAVIVTPENLPESEIVRYDPDTQMFTYAEAKKG